MRTDSLSQITKSKRSGRPKSYIELIERVGAYGKYQFRMFLIFMLIWFYSGIILMNTSFLFYNNDFDCQSHGLIVSSCEAVVCQMPKQHRSRFINKQESQFKSIAIEFGQFNCEEYIYVSLAKSSVYVGSILGILLFGYVSDNQGRKKSLMISLIVCVLGNALTSASSSLILTSIGLLLSGCGSNASINTTLCFFNEVTTNQKRQKFSILVQLSFTMGVVTAIGFYFMMSHWRAISIFLITIPSLLTAFLVFFYVQQTPQFLFKGQRIEAIKSLNKIGKVNFQIKNILEEEDLLSVKQSQTYYKQFDELKFHYLDLFRFVSLKSKTIFALFLCFVIYGMYYGSIIAISNLGFNIYSNNLIIQSSQFVVYLPIYVYINKIKRKRVGLTAFLIIALISILLILVPAQQDCDSCIQNTLQLILIVLARSVIAFYFCIFYLYINELYPIKITGLGVGFISAFGSLASALSPLAFSTIKINVLMTIFCLLAIVSVAMISLMEETQGKQMQIEIEEVQQLRKKSRQKMQSQRKFSFSRLSVLKTLSQQNNQ